MSPVASGRTALILVDLQNDFVDGGALSVPDGLAVVSIANALVAKFDLVIATQDWHPANHKSFASQHLGFSVGKQFLLNGLQQTAWPDHCIQGTRGAKLVDGLNCNAIDFVVRKGLDIEVDSYSGFYDNGKRSSTGLSEYLRREKVKSVFVMGLATDYCVKFTAIDACNEGFRTVLVLDGCRGVDLKPGDVENAISEMAKAGVAIANSQDFIKD